MLADADLRLLASRSRERVPFPREDAPALPSNSTYTGSGSVHGHSTGSALDHDAPTTLNNTTSANLHSSAAAMNRSLSLPTPWPSAGSVPAQVPVPSSDTAASNARANTLPGSGQGTNAHIPLAMQTRPRDTSDPHAALLAAAAARAPGSPPQRAQLAQIQAQSQHAHAASQSPTQPQSASSRQRTPERTVGQAPGQAQQQRTPERGLEREGLYRAGGLEREPAFRVNGLEREGSFRTPELALDVKRLLAKPASVSPARGRADSSDGASMGADGAGRSSLEGGHIRRKRYDTAGRRVERVDEGAEEGRGTRSEDGGARRSVRDQRDKKERDIVAAFVGPHEKEKEKEKRTKNVLKRRPSAPRPATAPTAAAASPATLTPATARAGPPVLSLNLSLNPIPLPFASYAAGGSSPRGSPCGSPGGASGSGSGSGQLTPAGAVVQAYKRGLDATSPVASPLPSPSSATFKRKEAAKTGASPSPPATPYYTVFGSTSGRVVAVGGPEDAWDGAGSYISSSAFPLFDGARSRSSKGPGSGSGSVGRTLTRKVSERWGRKREESESDETRGRTSGQGDRHGKKGVRSGSRTGERSSPAPEPDSAMWTTSSSGLGHTDDGFVNEPRSRRSEPALASGGGSKIWKLMKRISTGGLKEKYDRGPRTLPPIPPLPPMPNLPPVPQLPKDDNLEARSAMSSDGHSRDEPGVLSRFMQSRSSMSVSRPTSSGSGIPRPAARALPMPPPIPASHHPRASTTTRSSSPVSSSDVASSKYFHRTTGSGRSSTSSYGEETVPPPMPGVPILPNLVVGKHIVPPKDLYKLDLTELGPSSVDEKKVLVKPMSFFGTQNIRTPEDWTIVNTPAEEHPPSLPHPPRRLPVPNAAKDVSRLSTNRLSQTPSIPEFSTAAPINAFAARKLASTAGITESFGPSQGRRSTSETQAQDQFPSQSTDNASTARQKRIQQRSTSLPRVVPEPLTFRGMSEKPGQALTEKEKADRWDDLLERSERAGGTIHMGTSEKLASDDVSLRYSTSSTQLLKGAYFLLRLH
ncbi:hypothetical protein C8R43DRAFT_956219 [Mycena crocata]|nr:hypothetical protein C8R43DRAFT_956219 [Mycena crocata]